MTTVEPPGSRTQRGSAEGSPDEVIIVRAVPDWLRRQRRQQRRLRRTVVLGVVLLIAGAAFARWREDPGTVLAAGVAPMSSVLMSAGQDPASAGSAAPAALDGSAASEASAAQLASQASAASANDAVPAETAAPGSSATAHADTEDPPSAEPTPAASQQPVPGAGAGTISTVDIPSGPLKATGRTVAVGVDVEDGLPVSATDFAAVVHTVLVDPRGWQTQDDVRFVPVSAAERAAGAHVDIRVTLASPTLTAKLCAPLDTSVQQVSCWNGTRAVLNLTRWIRGASTYGNDLASYRDYLVSHEVGHGLGHVHVQCPGAGRPAPVMFQQTKDLAGCTAWPWPTSP
ncbi:MAG: DUF3152 domain-containing protein [Lapillicoccus sp.]